MWPEGVAGPDHSLALADRGCHGCSGTWSFTRLRNSGWQLWSTGARGEGPGGIICGRGLSAFTVGGALALAAPWGVAITVAGWPRKDAADPSQGEDCFVNTREPDLPRARCGLVSGAESLVFAGRARASERGTLPTGPPVLGWYHRLSPQKEAEPRWGCWSSDLCMGEGCAEGEGGGEWPQPYPGGPWGGTGTVEWLLLGLVTSWGQLWGGGGIKDKDRTKWAAVQ